MPRLVRAGDKSLAVLFAISADIKPARKSRARIRTIDFPLCVIDWSF